MTDDQAQASPPKHKKIWVFFALGACISWSFQDFLSALTGGLVGNPTPVIIIALITGLFGTGFCIFIHFKSHRFRNVTKRSILFACLAGVLTTIGVAFLQTGFIADQKSAGPIVAITSPACILTAFLSYVFLKEKLHAIYLAGIGLVIVGLVMIALANKGSAPAWFGVLFAMGALLFFAFGTFFNKCAAHSQADPLAMYGTMCLANLPLALICFLVFFVIPSPVCVPFTKYHWIAVGGGGLDLLGSLCLFIAMSIGPAGPVFAVSNSTSALVTIWNLLFRKLLPTPLKIAGMGVTILAVAELSLADLLHESIARCCARRKARKARDTEDKEPTEKDGLLAINHSPA
eukprot:gnl/Trimastix_PCT/3627.p1 GENE.gnl/Trimastix_PCT/3627~~gnl/Trimastix_PCT/3627.p1  ORF type:complete len:346 (+),score=110.38 gnl/Trimastix_PCT/3627:103-1140(+)